MKEFYLSGEEAFPNVNKSHPSDQLGIYFYPSKSLSPFLKTPFREKLETFINQTNIVHSQICPTWFGKEEWVDPKTGFPTENQFFLVYFI